MSYPSPAQSPEGDSPARAPIGLDDSAAIERLAAAFASGWRREPDLTVSQWADEHRMLSGTASSEPGHWRTSRVPYMREIMDCLSPSSPVERVVLMKGAQIAGTETANNWIGYVIHHAPAPMLMVQPTVETAERVSKQRIAPMIESTPALRDRVREARARDSGNTMTVKQFAGGILILTGANSGAGLRSMPIRFLLCDEVDEYPGDVDGQGDPVALAEERTATFPRRKIFLLSTPTIRGVSRIEREYLASDRRRFYLACPHCAHRDFLTWSGADWVGGDRAPHHRIAWEEGRPDTAHMICSSCSGRVEEGHKTAMLAAGEWRPTAEGDGRTRGYHLSGLYSPLGWKSWAKCAAQFMTTKDDPFRHKTWFNTVLGETWEERGDSIEPEGLLARAERYGAEVPAGVGVLVASVDVQGDRLEALVVGYGAAEEAWVIAHEQIHGDPGVEGDGSPWLELDTFLKQPFAHESGQILKIECTAIDSGGHHTEQVYRFCRARLARRVFAVRGGNESGKPIVSQPTVHNRYRAKLFTLCVDTAKDVIYSRLRIASPGPGYIHLPEWVDAEFVSQLTAEKKLRKYDKRRGSVAAWVKIRERNEVLDLAVYALAALYIAGQQLVRSLPDRAAALARRVGEVAPEKPAAPPRAPVRPPPRRTGWVNRW